MYVYEVIKGIRSLPGIAIKSFVTDTTPSHCNPLRQRREGRKEEGIPGREGKVEGIRGEGRKKGYQGGRAGGREGRKNGYEGRREGGRKADRRKNKSTETRM